MSSTQEKNMNNITEYPANYRRNFVQERINEVKNFSTHFSMLYQNFKNYIRPTLYHY